VSEPEKYPRTVLFVAGAGRSGTSTMAGLLRLLGLHVPQPEVVPDESNPKGFGEPQWVVDFHDRLLAEANVTVSDSRPSAWFETGRVATREPERILAAEWLEGHFADHDELIVKDPRLSWFLGLWRIAAIRSGATPVFATMLRSPAEVVGSKQKYYSTRFGEVSRTAAWVNMMLHTERATRDSDRAFVRYHDLLADWTVPLFSIGEQFGLTSVQTASAIDIRKVHQFIDPTLRRVANTWDDLSVPPRLREIAEESWHELDSLADPGGETPEVLARLDELRAAYADLYEESEALAQSSIIASKRKGARSPAPAATPVPPPPPGLADRIPHSVRRVVPAGLRRGLRKALGRER